LTVANMIFDFYFWFILLSFIYWSSIKQEFFIQRRQKTRWSMQIC